MGSGVSAVINVKKATINFKNACVHLKRMLAQHGGTKFTINDVDEQLKRYEESSKYKHKILLLGAGEAGKSTVLKQIKALSKIQPTPKRCFNT